jgi:hypothetical protein
MKHLFLKLLAFFLVAGTVYLWSCTGNDIGVEISGEEKIISLRNTLETEFRSLNYSVVDSGGFFYCLIPSGDHEWQRSSGGSWTNLAEGTGMKIYCDCEGPTGCHMRGVSQGNKTTIKCEKEGCVGVCEMSVEFTYSSSRDTIYEPVFVQFQ